MLSILDSNTSRDPTDLKLSDAQRQIFAGWRRPNEVYPTSLVDEISMGASPGSDLMTAAGEVDLVQDITTDCSVVASLCAGTSRASKGHGKVRNL